MSDIRARRVRSVLTARRVGRAVTVAACVAAVTCLVGVVVAWRLLGDLRSRSVDSLRLVESTLDNVDDSLAVAVEVATTVGASLDTLRDTLVTLTAGVEDGAEALGAIAALTEQVPPTLDRLDGTLADVSDAGRVVDDALGALDDLPFGPDIAGGTSLSGGIEALRDDIRPLAEDLRDATASIRELSGSSDDLTAHLDSLGDDLDDLDRSLARSEELLDRYRADTAEAGDIARQGLADIDRDIALSRALAVILAVTIAVGQIAPFHIGRQLAQRE